MMRLLPAMIMAGAIVMAFGGIASGRERLSPRHAEQQRAKARHFYLCGARYEAEEKQDMAAEMYRRAYEADSTYPEAALQHGIRRLLLIPDTLTAEKEYAEKMAEKFAASYPADIFSNLLFGRIMQRMGKTEVYLNLLEKVGGHNPDNTDLLRMLASAYSEAHEYEKALEKLDEYAKAEGEDLELTVEKASILLETGDTIGALAAVSRMEEKNPRNPEYPALKAQLYMYAGKQDSALLNVRKAEDMLRPGEGGQIQVQLAELYLESGDSLNYDARTYDALLSEDLNLESKNAILTHYLQRLISDNGDRTRGDRLFDGLLTLYPHEASVRELSSRYNASKQDYAKAEEDIDYALDLDHTNQAYWDLAMMYAISAERPERVKDVYARAIKNLDRPKLEFQLLSGNAFLMDDMPEEAIKIYEKSLAEYFPGQDLRKPIAMDSLARYLRGDNIGGLIGIYRQAGDAFYELKERDNAFVNYENALMLDSDNALALNNYAYFLIEKPEFITPENLEKADRMSERAVALDPGNPIYLDTRAWVLFMEEDYEGAKALMETLFSDDTAEMREAVDQGEFYFHYGDILYMAGDKDGAREAWTKALELTEADPKEDAKIIEDIRHRLKSGVPESTLYKRSVNEKSEQK